jgi:hypothetical protein
MRTSTGVDVRLALEEEDELEVRVGVPLEVPDPALVVEALAELQLRTLERDGVEESEDRFCRHGPSARPKGRARRVDRAPIKARSQGHQGSRPI